MKKILIATTALVATAGMAAADITFSGGARFGVIYSETPATAAVAEVAAVPGNAGTAAVPAAAADSSTDVHNRITINIDGTAETDSGVEFFGRVRIRGGNTGDGATAGSTISAPRVGARIGGLTVAVGNIAGAIDSLPGLYAGSIGFTGLGDQNQVASGAANYAYDSFSSGGGGSNGVEVIYSANGLGVHLSSSSLAAGDRTALGLSYTFGDWTVALGHQSADVAAEDFTTLTATGTIGSVVVGAQIADNDGDSAYRVNAQFDVGAATIVEFFVADQDNSPDTAYGLGFEHSLGGATLAGGIVSRHDGDTAADLGVRFNF